MKNYPLYLTAQYILYRYVFAVLELIPNTDWFFVAVTASYLFCVCWQWK